MSEPTAEEVVSLKVILAAGYKEFPTTRMDNASRMFQRRVEDDDGTLYFINFRMWDLTEYGHGTSFDAEIACETSTGGSVWLTIKEPSLQATETRAAALWAAAGSVYYEKSYNHAG